MVCFESVFEQLQQLLWHCIVGSCIYMGFADNTSNLENDQSRHLTQIYMCQPLLRIFMAPQEVSTFNMEIVYPLNLLLPGE